MGSKTGNSAQPYPNAHFVQLVSFKLADEEYAVDILLIVEVVKPIPVTAVPQTPDYCLGVVNFRGVIIPVFDLRKIVQLPPRPFGPRTRLLITVMDDSMAGWVVDEVKENMRIDGKQVDLAATLAMKIGKEYILGVAHVGERILAVLDFRRMQDVILEEMTAKK